MDSSNLDFFLSLLRSGLYGTPVQADEVPPTVDWKQVITFARQQTVMGLVFDAASRLPAEVQPPKQIKSEMLALSLRVMDSHTLLNSTLAEVVETYRRHGIECVLLKGQGLARCYQKPHLRQCGDIDLYIGKKSYAKSVEVAAKTLDTGHTEPTESIKHYHFNRGKAIVELHRIAALMHTPIRNTRFNRWIESELDNTARLRTLDFNGTQVYVPSADFDALFIFYHAWYHFVNGGIGLRQLCDWTMVLHTHKDEIDREALCHNLKKFGLMKAWQIFAGIAVDRLGLPQEEMPFYSPQERANSVKAMKKVVTGGNFGFFDTNSVLSHTKGLPLLKRKMYLLRRLVKNFRAIFAIIPLESTICVTKIMVRGSIHSAGQLIGEMLKKNQRH